MTEEEKLSIKEQFNCIVKDGIVPVLKSAGFKKKGNNFHAHVGELDWCINIQTDRWGFDDYSNTWQFTINVGVTWGDYAMCLFNEVCDFPLENSCPIRTRIGNFIGKEDYWFILHPNQDCSPIKDLICSILQNRVLPLLKQHQCLNDLWDLIEDNHSIHTFLIKLFHVRSKQKVFWATPIGLYMLCLATGKAKKAKSLRSKMEQRKANTSLLDKIQKHTNSSGIMKQTDDISRVLSTFKTLAATQVAATENGDYKKGNKAFKQIIQIIKYLKELGRVNELEALLSDSNVGVRMFAAYGLLQTSPDVAVPILKEIAQREDIHSLTAKLTLEQWKSNTLIYPF